MPGGGPSPAETTLPLALKWPAPPARPTRPHRSPPPGPPGSPGAPPGWRRVPRTTGYPPAGPAQPRYPQPGYPSRPPGAPGPPGPPGPPGGGPGAGAPPARLPGIDRDPALQPGAVQRRHGGRHPGLAGHRLPAHPRPGLRVRHPGARQRVQQRQHAAERRLLPDARRHLHQRGGAAAGPRGQARPRPRRGLRPAHVHPGHAGACSQSPWWRRSWPLRWWTCTRPPSTAPSTT